MSSGPASSRCYRVPRASRAGLFGIIVRCVEGIVFRYRTGQTLWKRHARFSRDGTWGRVLEQLVSKADATDLYTTGPGSRRPA